MREGFKNCSFRGNALNWELFKEYCKSNNTDASKVIRNYISEILIENADFVEENKELCLDKMLDRKDKK